jgi:uncharacterized membrane protein HdeD (DUF308 family)
MEIVDKVEPPLFAHSLVEHWWLFLIRGILAIIFGILAMMQPLAALAALVLVFGVWALIDGAQALALAVSGRARSWPMALAGLAGVGIGIFTFYRPGITALGLYAAVAAWSIAHGVFEIVVAIDLRKSIEGEAWLILGGIASIVFGVLLIVLPTSGVLALGWLIGLYALIFGAIMLALAFRLRDVHRKVQRGERVFPHAPTPQYT